jgi:hypothetical protein
VNTRRQKLKHTCGSGLETEFPQCWEKDSFCTAEASVSDDVVTMWKKIFCQWCLFLPAEFCVTINADGITIRTYFMNNLRRHQMSNFYETSYEKEAI